MVQTAFQLTVMIGCEKKNIVASRELCVPKSLHPIVVLITRDGHC